MSGRRDLGEDVIHEILLRTDVKQLLRCKLLNKTYNNLISSSSFVSKHLHKSKLTPNKNDNIVVAVDNVHKMDYQQNIVYLRSPESQVYLPPCLASNSIAILGSCNGLLVVRGQDKIDGRNAFYLCNPATREYEALPPPPGERSSDIGFGYDALSGDYKVVKILANRCYSYKNQLRFRRRLPLVDVAVEVWRTSTNRWTKVESCLPNILKECHLVRAGLLVGGNLYWLAECSNQRQVLLSFRLADDTVHEITSVSEVVSRYASCCMDMTEFNGSLLLFVEDVFNGGISSGEHYGGRLSGEHDIWLMKNDDSGISWTRQFSVRAGISRFPQTRVCVNWKFERLVGSEFWVYGPQTELNRFIFPSSKFELWSFVESLVSVKESSEDDHIQETGRTSQ